jgi:hypothetical protein
MKGTGALIASTAIFLQSGHCFANDNAENAPVSFLLRGCRTNVSAPLF